MRVKSNLDGRDDVNQVYKSRLQYTLLPDTTDLTHAVCFGFLTYGSYKPTKGVLTTHWRLRQGSTPEAKRIRTAQRSFIRAYNCMVDDDHKAELDGDIARCTANFDNSRFGITYSLACQSTFRAAFEGQSELPDIWHRYRGLKPLERVIRTVNAMNFNSGHRVWSNIGESSDFWDRIEGKTKLEELIDWALDKNYLAPPSVSSHSVNVWKEFFGYNDGVYW